ncbi:ATP-binding protein [Actinomadura soli]|uniref:ATP-binding protein n=1 Tax=Actinomadura soli TaxID=2508997 RepID=UPI00267E99EA|nr:ATP-binding protein [Actinomadura soli]
MLRSRLQRRVVRVLLAEEAASRDRANLHIRRKRAGFPAGKTFGDWDETASSIPRPTQDALKSLEWVRRRKNLCICGPSGIGKSHFSEVLAQTAVEAGMTVTWFNTEDLGALVRRHRADDSIARALTRIIRTDLMIIDDMGLLPVSPDAAEGFYRLVDAAYERRTLAVTPTSTRRKRTCSREGVQGGAETSHVRERSMRLWLVRDLSLRPVQACVPEIDRVLRVVEVVAGGCGELVKCGGVCLQRGSHFLKRGLMGEVSKADSGVVPGSGFDGLG